MTSVTTWYVADCIGDRQAIRDVLSSWTGDPWGGKVHDETQHNAQPLMDMTYRGV